MAIGEMAVKAYGKYFLVRKLAEGGMAEIFLAKSMGVEGFEKNVVIKRMLPHLSTAPDFVSMFLDEARLAASLAHPNIVQISDLGLADGCYYICMEYLAGEDFATVLRTAKRRGEHTPLNIVLRVIGEAAVGLHFAHEALDPKGQPLNLVHRDISPSNVFITYSGQVKVLDFGIAKAESRATATGAGVVKGKYQYMSPEQARGDGPVDRRSDVFSLGVSLYEAVTGQRPFARDTDLAVLKAVLEGEYQPVRALRPDLPLEVESIINKAMAQEAEHRYPSALAMAQDIERYIGATTSASGGQALVNFMAGFFGPERVKSKTRIESLDELSARGIDVPGKSNPLSPKTDVGVLVQPNQDRTNVLATPGNIKTDPARGGGAGKPWALILGALVAGVVGAVVVVKMMQPPVVVPVVVVDAGVSQPLPPVVDAGIAPVVDAGLAVAPAPDAGSEEVVDAGRVVPAKPIQLTAVIVKKRIDTVKGRIQKCFQDHKVELPTPQGVLRVDFEIAPSGKVTSITTSLPGTAVSKCVEGAVKSAGFPRHVDQGIHVPLPLSWDVRP
ncbi:MAG: serine/threonine protein kinase [Archangium sp.]|nr:serine/threonine protein kinase [Archangium sp.]